ncbi:MAG: protein-glutamate O-methyltransferase CheR [Devosia sp.]
MLDPNEFALDDHEFDRIRARLYEVSGISLSAAKRTLVIARLGRQLRALGLASFTAYLDHLEHRASPAEQQEFVNALTTNLTRFWREEHHFTHLVDHVGELMRTPHRQRRLRIWSAGCSTGQEPYTIALTLLRAYPDLKRWDFKILATDIDTAVIAKAATGSYPEGDVADLPPDRLALFDRPGDGRARIPAAVAAHVSFKPLNLMAPWPMKGPFDAIFCRNVTIYFDRPTQTEVFARMGEILAPDGYLYIGHSENLGLSAPGFHLVGKTVYQANPGQHRARNAA